MELQRYLDNPGEVFSQWLQKLAPRGWNANTQFFLVFLGILGIHLWLLPLLMEAAGKKEPGDSLVEVATGAGENTGIETDRAGNQASPLSSRKISSTSSAPVETLVLTDPPMVASPVEDPDPDRGQEELAEAESDKPKPGGQESSPTAESAVSAAGGELAMVSDPAVELLTGNEAEPAKEEAKPEATPDESEGAVAQSRPLAQPIEEEERKKAEPRLSDLVTEARAEESDGSTGPESGPGMRTFRSLR